MNTRRKVRGFKVRNAKKEQEEKREVAPKSPKKVIPTDLTKAKKTSKKEVKDA